MAERQVLERRLLRRDHDRTHETRAAPPERVRDVTVTCEVNATDAVCFLLQRRGRRSRVPTTNHVCSTQVRLRLTINTLFLSITGHDIVTSLFSFPWLLQRFHPQHADVRAESGGVLRLPAQTIGRRQPHERCLALSDRCFTVTSCLFLSFQIKLKFCAVTLKNHRNPFDTNIHNKLMIKRNSNLL